MKRTLIILFAATMISAGCKEKSKLMGPIDYKEGETQLQGYMATPKDVKGKVAGILIIHEWWGHTEYVQKRARMLAELGYVAFAMDMYGKGIIAKDHETAGKLSSGYFKDPALRTRRLNAALEQLRNHPNVDAEKIAVIGYCFGGAVAIEMAKEAMPVKAIVSFHGMLNPPKPEAAANIKAKMLIHHGADDGFIKPEAVEGFQQALEDAGVDFEFVSHPGAVHGFTRASAGSDNSTGIAYNEAADKKSWQSMKDFFKKVL